MKWWVISVIHHIYPSRKENCTHKQKQHRKLKIIKSAGQRNVVLHGERRYKPHEKCDTQVYKAVAFWSVLEVSISGLRTRRSHPFSSAGSWGMVSWLR